MLAVELDKLIGQRFYLNRDLQTYNNSTYRKGSIFLIVDRWCIYLHGQVEGKSVVCLRPEWVDFKKPIKIAQSASG